MNTPVVDNRHVREYFLYGIVAAVLYLLPVLYLLFEKQVPEFIPPLHWECFIYGYYILLFVLFNLSSLRWQKSGIHDYGRAFGHTGRYYYSSNRSYHSHVCFFSRFIFTTIHFCRSTGQCQLRSKNKLSIGIFIHDFNGCNIGQYQRRRICLYHHFVCK